VGNPLELTCRSDERTQLSWVRQTPETAWQDHLVEPTVGSSWVIRTLTEEPSGFVESTLIKSEVELHDRGMYICRDAGNVNSFSVWVTALQSKQLQNLLSQILNLPCP